MHDDGARCLISLDDTALVVVRLAFVLCLFTVYILSLSAALSVMPHCLLVVRSGVPLAAQATVRTMLCAMALNMVVPLAYAGLFDACFSCTWSGTRNLGVFTFCAVAAVQAILQRLPYGSEEGVYILGPLWWEYGGVAPLSRNKLWQLRERHYAVHAPPSAPAA